MLHIERLGARTDDVAALGDIELDRLVADIVAGVFEDLVFEGTAAHLHSVHRRDLHHMRVAQVAHLGADHRKIGCVRHLYHGVGGAVAVERAALDADVGVGGVAGITLVDGGVLTGADHVGNRLFVADKNDVVERERGVAVDMQRRAQVIAARLHNDFVTVVFGGAVARRVERRLDRLESALLQDLGFFDGDLRKPLLFLGSGACRKSGGSGQHDTRKEDG